MHCDLTACTISKSHCKVKLSEGTNKINRQQFSYGDIVHFQRQSENVKSL
jgi:hypothetical protein